MNINLLLYVYERLHFKDVRLIQLYRLDPDHRASHRPDDPSLTTALNLVATIVSAHLQN